MSTNHMRIEVSKIAQEINATCSKKYLCPIIKIMKMRHGQLNTQQIKNITKEVLD